MAQPFYANPQRVLRFVYEADEYLRETKGKSLLTDAYRRLRPQIEKVGASLKQKEKTKEKRPNLVNTEKLEMMISEG